MLAKEGSKMRKRRYKNVDERINDFLVRKTTPKNLSQIIADHLVADTKPKKSSNRYEVLPLRLRRTAIN